MGTLKDAIDTAIAADNWCADGPLIIEGRPHGDPSAYYDACDTAYGFLQVCNIANASKAKALFLQSLLELTALMPASEEKTRLTAIGDETAVLADELTWFTANEDDSTECRYLVKHAVNLLDGGNTVDAWAAYRNLVRAKAEVDKSTITAENITLLALWKSRCTLDEWKNSLT